MVTLLTINPGQFIAHSMIPIHVETSVPVSDPTQPGIACTQGYTPVQNVGFRRKGSAASSSRPEPTARSRIASTKLSGWVGRVDWDR